MFKRYCFIIIIIIIIIIIAHYASRRIRPSHCPFNAPCCVPPPWPHSSSSTPPRLSFSFDNPSPRKKDCRKWHLQERKRVVEMAEMNKISCEVQRRWWNWPGHVLRRKSVNVCFTALGWTLEGWGARGRPKTTWRNPVEWRGEKWECVY